MIRKSRLVSALMATTVVSASLAFYNDNAIAQTSFDAGAAGTAAPQDANGHHGPRGRAGLGMGLGRAGAALQLTDAQRQSIAQIVRDSRNEARQRIYAVLTPEQQARLPKDFTTK